MLSSMELIRDGMNCLDMLDDILIHVHCMKEPDYVMMLMSSYGTLSECGEEKMTLQSKWTKTGEDVQVH